MGLKSISVFNELADQYDSWFDRHPAVFQSELEALKKVVPNSGQGLEIGVGSGRFAAALGIKIGIEPSKKLGEIAKSRGIDVIMGVAESLPIERKQYDFILLNTVLCFLDSPLKGLSEAKRILKSNGLLIIGMIDRNSELGQSYEMSKKDNPFYQYAHFYSANEVVDLLTQIGFYKQEIYQTLFTPPKNIVRAEPVKPGYGEGGFVVIKATREKG
ncbi:class I SAM-dependent methyltransferase [Legionella pneumophila]|uniref:class I SAM-dependent methyltransferase n=1 Tax=Legionella pneumophila TaxID=446 RepID=UPI000D084B16|nr:class I SAM-dependent methyltransferase [Legionella pneumophila]